MLFLLLSIAESERARLLEGKAYRPVVLRLLVEAGFARNYLDRHELVAPLIRPVEGHLLAGLNDDRVAFHRFLGEDQGRLRVIDDHIARLNCSDLRVEGLCRRASLHIGVVAELEQLVALGELESTSTAVSECDDRLGD